MKLPRMENLLKAALKRPQIKPDLTNPSHVNAIELHRAITRNKGPWDSMSYSPNPEYYLKRHPDHAFTQNGLFVFIDQDGNTDIDGLDSHYPDSNMDPETGERFPVNFLMSIIKQPDTPSGLWTIFSATTYERGWSITRTDKPAWPEETITEKHLSCEDKNENEDELEIPF